jgi:hypothetical protein
MARDLDATFFEPIPVVLPREENPESPTADYPRGTAFVAVGDARDGKQLV